MTELPNQPSQQPQQPYAGWTPPPQMQPMAPPMPQSNSPGPPPVKRSRRGVVTVVAAATLAAGALGGTIGALVGSHDATSAAAAPAPAATQPVSANTSTDVSSVVAKVMPSVVQVNVSSTNEKGIGSGVIVSSTGKIVTNNHVVSGADKVTVTLSDGRTVDAGVISTDPSADLAVIQAKGVSGLTAATLGDSDSVKIGDQVIAIGSPAGLQGTVTTGIVSALNREVSVPGEQSQRQFPFSSNASSSKVTYHAIQTDASINQGNSGGPLFNADGQVIGINSAMYSPVSSADGSAGSVGIGFAIPINQVKGVIGG